MKAKHESNLIAPPKIETLDPQPGELFWTRGGEESWITPCVALILMRTSTEVCYVMFYHNQRWCQVGLGSTVCAECPSTKNNPKPQSWFLMQRLSDEDAAKFRRGEKIGVTPSFFIEQKQA